MSEPTKRAWIEPELIAIARGKPAERVLEACKTSGSNGPIPQNPGCGTSSSCLGQLTS